MRPQPGATWSPIGVRHWLVGALNAGLALGVAESVFARWVGESTPALVMGGLLAASALRVALPMALVPLVLRRSTRSRSALVLAGTVSIGLAPVLGPARVADVSPWLLAAGVALAVLLAAELGDLVEQRQGSLAALPLWGVAAVLVAGGERVLASGGDARLVTGLAAGAVALAIVLTLAHRAMLNAPGTQPLSLGFGLAVLLVGAVLAAGWPVLRPLLSVGPAPRTATGRSAPANLVVCAVPAWALTREPFYWLEAVAEATPGAREVPAAASMGRLFAGGRERPLFARLSAHGYRTVAFVPSRSASVPAGLYAHRVAPDLDAALAEAARWSSGRPLLMGLLRLEGARGLLGDGVAPGVDEASTWILAWSQQRDPPPFALYLDLRPPSGAREDLRRVDRALGRLFTTLADLGLRESTVVVLVEPARDGEAQGRALVAARSDDAAPQAGLVRAVVRALRADAGEPDPEAGRG